MLWPSWPTPLETQPPEIPTRHRVIRQPAFESTTEKSAVYYSEVQDWLGGGNARSQSSDLPSNKNGMYNATHLERVLKCTRWMLSSNLCRSSSCFPRRTKGTWHVERAISLTSRCRTSRKPLSFSLRNFAISDESRRGEEK